MPLLVRERTDYMITITLHFQFPRRTSIKRILLPIISSPSQSTRAISHSSITMGISDYASADGEFRRKDTSFRNHIEVGGKYPPEKDRYHLYVSWACPWGISSSALTDRSFSNVDCSRTQGIARYYH
jgi:hypothetical protein